MSKITQNITALIILVICLVVFIILGVNLTQKNQEMENNFGKAFYNSGSIGSITTDSSDATLIIERNTGRSNLIITNTGSEAVYVWRRNYTGTTTASAEVTNYSGGFYLGANGGSYETGENDEGQSFTWIGDLWASSTSVPVIITYDEK